MVQKKLRQACLLKGIAAGSTTDGTKLAQRRESCVCVCVCPVAVRKEEEK